MRTTVLKLAALGALVLFVGAAAVPVAASDARPTLDGIPPVALGTAELRADADDSGRVVAELRVGARRVKASFAPDAIEGWAAAADSVAVGAGEARTPMLTGRDGEHFFLDAAEVDGARTLALYAATDDSLVMVHANVAEGDAAPAIGTLRHAAKVARAVRFVTRR